MFEDHTIQTCNDDSMAGTSEEMGEYPVRLCGTAQGHACRKNEVPVGATLLGVCHLNMQLMCPKPQNIPCALPHVLNSL